MREDIKQKIQSLLEHYKVKSDRFFYDRRKLKYEIPAVWMNEVMARLCGVVAIVNENSAEGILLGSIMDDLVRMNTATQDLLRIDENSVPDGEG